LALAEDKVTNYTFHLTYFNIWRCDPPSRCSNRRTWQVSGSQAAAQSTPA